MPPQGPLLPLNGKFVGVTPTWSNWALRHKFWSICPSRSHLPNAMPVGEKNDTNIIKCKPRGTIYKVNYYTIVVVYINILVKK
jgi:hypothetical protein